MVVAHTDLKMALESRIIRFSLAGITLFGPLIAVLLLGLPLAFMDLGPDRDMLLFVMKPMLTGLIGMFSIFPAAFISANSIVGEREQNTIEPLLCTPLTDRELLWGKTLSSLIPSISILVCQTALSSAGVNVVLLVVQKPLLMFPDLSGLFVLGVVAPVGVLATISVMVIISGKVSRVYEAYQTVGAVTLVFMIPMVAPLIVLFTGTSGPLTVWSWNLIAFLIASILATLSWTVAVNRFNRDTIVSRI